MEIKNKAYSKQGLDGPSKSEILNRELHRVVSTAIIYKPPHQNFGGGGKDRKYLIVQRNKSKKAFPGRWTVPGGGLEVDDYINLPKTVDGFPQ